MHWIKVFIHLLWVVYTLAFNHSIVLRNTNCSTTYHLDGYESVKLDYNGSDILFSETCFFEFTKSSHEHYLCIYTDQVRLDCETNLEYHDWPLTSYPLKRLTCYDISVKGDEWCPRYEFIDEIIVVIKKPPRETSDVVKLRISLKHVQDPDPEKEISPSDTSNAVYLVAIFPVLIFVFFIICVYQHRKKAQSAQTPQTTHQTIQGTVDMQIGRQPQPDAHFQDQPSATPFVLGDYHVHPMQSAFPVTSLQSPAPASSAPAQVATQQTFALAPPPSYESVVAGNNYSQTCASVHL